MRSSEFIFSCFVSVRHLPKPLSKSCQWQSQFHLSLKHIFVAAGPCVARTSPPTQPFWSPIWSILTRSEFPLLGPRVPKTLFYSLAKIRETLCSDLIGLKLDTAERCVYSSKFFARVKEDPLSKSYLRSMAIQVVEFSNGGYRIRKVWIYDWKWGSEPIFAVLQCKANSW